MTRLARVLAILGGIVLLLLIVLTCVSVLGRMANTLGHTAFVHDHLQVLSAILTRLGPVKGDFELVEAGIAFSIVAFLPWCQLTRGHATVELFASVFSKTGNRLLSLAWEIVFAATTIIIAWRLFVGMTDKLRYGETTFLLQFPVWWGYAFAAFAAAIASVVALYCVWLHLKELFSSGQAVERVGSPKP